jgi:ParB family chromosome partitioning protein
MKAAEALKAKFGSVMRESMGVERDAATAVPVAAPSSGLAAKYDGTSRLNRALAIPVDRIVPDPNQPRKAFDPGDLHELTESLKARGQLQPIRVRWDDGAASWIIISGERRWRAARNAGLETLQCIEAKGPLTEDEVLEDQLVENLLRENLDPIEQANAFKTLIDRRGMTQFELAGLLRISPGRSVRSCLY